jgi:hypothetical protein
MHLLGFEVKKYPTLINELIYVFQEWFVLDYPEIWQRIGPKMEFQKCLRWLRGKIAQIKMENALKQKWFNN